MSVACSMPRYIMYNQMLEKVTAADIMDMDMAVQVAEVWNQRHADDPRQQIYIVMDDDNRMARAPKAG